MSVGWGGAKKGNSLQPDLVVIHLSHMDELGEDLGSLLGCVSAEDHQLDPLGHSVTHHDRPLQGGVFPHRALHHVAAVVQELTNQITQLRHTTTRVSSKSLSFSSVIYFSFTSRLFDCMRYRQHSLMHSLTYTRAQNSS